MMHVRFTTFNRSFMKQSFGETTPESFDWASDAFENTLSAFQTKWYNKKDGIYERRGGMSNEDHRISGTVQGRNFGYFIASASQNPLPLIHHIYLTIGMIMMEDNGESFEHLKFGVR